MYVRSHLENRDNWTWCLTAVLLFCSSVEDRNFALFNFVNEQTNEAEALKEEISKVSVFFPPLNHKNDILFPSAVMQCAHTFVIQFTNKPKITTTTKNSER